MLIYHVFEHLEALKLVFWKKIFLSMYPLSSVLDFHFDNHFRVAHFDRNKSKMNSTPKFNCHSISNLAYPLKPQASAAFDLSSSMLDFHFDNHFRVVGFPESLSNFRLFSKKPLSTY